MADLVIAGILLIIVGAAIAYIIREKKKGVKCIGCPAAGACSAKSAQRSDSGCGYHSNTKETNMSKKEECSDK